MAIIGEKITLDKTLVGNIARNQMESKMELTMKGALYVGTGDTNSVIPDGGGNAVPIPITSHIAPSGASDDGNVLVADSKSPVGWAIKECPKATEATTVSTNIGQAKITDIFEDDGTTVKTAALAKGLESNTAQSTGTGNTWYNFNGNSNSFGSLAFPTILRTLEPRPKAEVKSGETTMIKEIALEEDIPRVGEWVTVTGDTTTLTEAGTYQVIAGVTDMQSIVYWDGKTQAYGTRNTLPLVTTTENPVLPSIYCAYPHIDSNGELSVQYYYISMRWDNSAYVWYRTNISKFSGFKYRKINYKE